MLADPPGRRKAFSRINVKETFLVNVRYRPGNHLRLHERKPFPSHWNSVIMLSISATCVSSYAHSCLLNWTRGNDHIFRDRRKIRTDIAGNIPLADVLWFRDSVILQCFNFRRYLDKWHITLYISPSTSPALQKNIFHEIFSLAVAHFVRAQRYNF